MSLLTPSKRASSAKAAAVEAVQDTRAVVLVAKPVAGVVPVPQDTHRRITRAVCWTV